MNDQPTLFVEAYTISSGELYSDIKQIFVPPADKMVNVSITPDKDDYRPAQKATYKLKLK